MGGKENGEGEEERWERNRRKRRMGREMRKNGKMEQKKRRV